MVEVKRPVFMTGENPGMTLHHPGSEEPSAVLSYWHCTDSAWGPGNALILWMRDAEGRGIFTDNRALALAMTERLTRHFPEFKGVPLDSLVMLDAEVEHVFDGECYRVVCRFSGGVIEAEWREPLDCKQVIWSRFPAGDAAYDLTTVIRPCGLGRITVEGVEVAGRPKVETQGDGHRVSTAFLAFAETWVGPLSSEREVSPSS